MKVLVIIPTYNEADNIENIIELVLEQDKRISILVVDDNSPDKTYERVRKLEQFMKSVFLIKRSKKMGLGSAYVEGFKYALNHGFDLVFEMDADMSHDPSDIPGMIEAAEDSDLVIGSRYCGGINVVNWPLKRLILSYFAGVYVRFITGMPIKDPTAGFKCFRREVLENLDLDGILSDGYLFQIEVNYRVWLSGRIIKEIPIVFTERRSGKSKMSKHILYEAVWKIWKLKYLAMRKKLI